jgi:flavin-dependent dehydrogenase
MAGLFAARVLADHFEQVTIIERDRLPDGPVFRAGVPQGRHVHGLLLRGLQILEQMFPGISQELEAAGAQRIDWIKDLAFHTVYGVLPRFASPYQVLTCSRPLLEWTTRRRLAAHPQMRFLEAREAIGLLPNAQKTGVAGVRVRERNPEAHEIGKEEELTADLVVDASGRDSSVLEWLAALGYELPEEVVIDGKLGYATRIYQRPRAFQPDWQVLALLNSWPDIRRGGIILPIEEDRWIVTVAGIGDDHPPTDETGFLTFVEGMQTPLLADALKQAEPLTPIYGYQRMENRWRHFERLARWPEGFLAVGDAVCHLNPYYGQGMAVAAQTAVALEQRLKGGQQPEMARRFQQAVANIFAGPWVLATSEDMRSPITVGGGHPGAVDRLMYRYVDGVKRRIARDPKALRTFVEVSHLLKPSSAMMRPGMVWGVLTQPKGRPARP